ncbi:MAG TPA: FAD:protein FMN transferase [Candidatus Nitrosocosmicus sp.]|nr:FAD:protein FMN transferase [Candidatus Nitrosocosmicus sp.]
MSRKAVLVAIMALLAALTLSGCQSTTPAPVEKTGPISKTDFLLGTVVEVTIYDKSDETILDKALARIAEIENKMTINNADTSEIITLNNASGVNEVKLSPDTFFVVEKGLEYSKRSKGAFDITVGPVVKQWNIGTEYAAIPDKDKLAEAVKLVDYERLSLNKDKLTARLADAGMKVDLGAIAKGYAADEVARVLKENGVQHAIINLGGNVMTVGGNPNGNPWKIGIQDPFNPRGEFLGIVPIKDQTVVTSGTYERFFEVDGKKYHHILNTTTGYPTDNNLYSVSIITDKSVDGDGYSTTCLLLGLEEGIKLMESTENTEAIFITSDKKVYVTSGLKKDFIVTNAEFDLVN